MTTALQRINDLLEPYSPTESMDHQDIVDALEAAKAELMELPTELETFAGATRMIHELAKSKGWWDCETCKGRGRLAFDSVEGPDGTIADPHGDPLFATCPTCKGSGEHRNFGQSIALVTSELSEALEAARQPGVDGLCDKCGGLGYGADDGTHDPPPCRKCNQTGKALGGSRMHEELLDAIIRLLDLSGQLGVDVAGVLAQKHAYNTTRARKHGKRF